MSHIVLVVICAVISVNGVSIIFFSEAVGIVWIFVCVNVEEITKSSLDDHIAEGGIPIEIILLIIKLNHRHFISNLLFY